MFRTMVLLAPTGVSTVVIVSAGPWESSACPPPGNRVAGDTLRSHRAAKSAANPDAPRTESRTNRKLRAPASSLPPTPPPANQQPDARRLRWSAAARDRAAPATPVGSSARIAVQSENDRHK